VEQELFTLPEHMSSPPVFSGIRVPGSLVVCVCFVDRYLSFRPLCYLFFFDIRSLITPLVSSSSSYNIHSILLKYLERPLSAGMQCYGYQMHYISIHCQLDQNYVIHGKITR
jgi:hypothetical protein